MTNLTRILPGQTIGIVGGGQLGQMMALSAKAQGFVVGVLDPTPNCPCAQVCDWQIVAEYDDEDALKNLAQKSDVVTFEFENVDVATLDDVAELTYFPQGTQLLSISQNRLSEKAFLSALNIPVAPYAAINSFDELKKVSAELGFPSVLKTTTGGYDGKGQLVLKNTADLDDAKELIQFGPCVLEKWVPFVKELSIMVARNEDGEVSYFPVVENIHRHNILHETIVPARVNEKVQSEVQHIAETIAHNVKLVGTLAVEIFLTAENKIYVNELAPRPHNSGHYSIEACTISQFDAHVRAVCNWPLPKINLISSAIMVNILGEHLEGTYRLIGEKPDWHFHLYGKAESKLGRKMGHITILTNDVTRTLNEVAETKNWD